MSEVKKMPCPDCETEISEDDKECPKCGFNIDNFDVFFRNFRAATKLLGKPKKAGDSSKKRSFLDHLANLGGK